MSGLSSTLGAKFFHEEVEERTPLARMHEGSIAVAWKRKNFVHNTVNR